MAYNKKVKNAREDLDHSVGLAVEINRLAEECWLDGPDIRLERIARVSKKIQEAIARVNVNLFGQDTLFGTGEEEANRSRGPGHREG
jgi:hypothetical protein